MRTSVVAVVAALVFGVIGCSSTSSAPQSAGGGTQRPAVALATLDQGTPNPSADDVSRWQSRLDLLGTYCSGDDRFLSDTIVQAYKVAHEHGASVTYVETAAGITRQASASGSGSNQNCDKLAQQWVTETVGS